MNQTFATVIVYFLYSALEIFVGHFKWTYRRTIQK